MKRRELLKGTFAAATLAGVSTVSNARAAQTPAAGREFYELRTYHVKSAAKLPVVENYLQHALIPALNRLGCRPVGVFSPVELTDPPQIFVLVPHASADSLANVARRLSADMEYLRAGAPYLDLPATDPACDRIESSLLMASFSGMPKMEIPKAAAGKASRLLQLRIYESHNEAAAKKKIEMFNSGEIAIFRRVGLNPVLFGETIAGARMPNLTYLLAFADKAALDKAWATFRADPEWLKLKAIPDYADAKIVSKITNKVCKPAAYSQI
ncbi:MAG: NIPSNAP family protein [Verrucomicrobia bacterium]|nr:NIPSNAP family protein [Verrucomicrobiota bacterium]